MNDTDKKLLELADPRLCDHTNAGRRLTQVRGLGAGMVLWQHCPKCKRLMNVIDRFEIPMPDEFSGRLPAGFSSPITGMDYALRPEFAGCFLPNLQRLPEYTFPRFSRWPEDYEKNG